MFHRYKKDNNDVCRFKESIQKNKITAMVGDHINIKLSKWDAVAAIKGIYLSNYLIYNCKINFLNFILFNLIWFNYHLYLWI